VVGHERTRLSDSWYIIEDWTARTHDGDGPLIVFYVTELTGERHYRETVGTVAYSTDARSTA